MTCPYESLFIFLSHRFLLLLPWFFVFLFFPALLVHLRLSSSAAWSSSFLHIFVVATALFVVIGCCYCIVVGDPFISSSWWVVVRCWWLFFLSFLLSPLRLVFSFSICLCHVMLCVDFYCGYFDLLLFEVHQWWKQFFFRNKNPYGLIIRMVHTDYGLMILMIFFSFILLCSVVMFCNIFWNLIMYWFFIIYILIWSMLFFI